MTPINEKLPKNKRVTKWSANYIDYENRVMMAIIEIGRKKFEDYHKINLPIPDYLEEIKKFGENYPIEIELYVENFAESIP